VERRHHFPSDVLAGVTPGNFLSAFICDAFIGLPESKVYGLAVSPQRGP